jgi:hypothetical protein
MKRLLTTTAILAAATFGAQGLAAPVTIDDFTTSQTLTIGSDADGEGSATGGGILGGSREVTISNQDPFDLDLETIFAATNGTGRFESGASGNGAGIVSTFILEYDGTADGSFDPAGLGGVDLVDGTNTSFQFGSNFVDGTSTLTFEVFDNDSSDSVDVTLDMAGIFTIAFSEFVGIDFTQVNAFRFVAVNDAAAADFNLNFIEAAPTADIVIPVPGAALLFAGAVAGFAVSRRKKA